MLRNPQLLKVGYMSGCAAAEFEEGCAGAEFLEPDSTATH